MRKQKIIFFIGIVVILLMKEGLVAGAGENESSMINRYNVVLILDASNSINYTDPDGLRYEAISLFIDLLAEEGNYLGGVVFSNHVEAQQPLNVVTTQEDKDAVISLLSSVMSNGYSSTVGYTNIGEALSTAVDMLITDGNEDLPSVILFLSDGNTEMPTEEELEASLDLKAEALITARENDIQIYTVCLNANEKADTAEMEQISTATGGVFQEISSAEDLQEVFHTFYNLIYGTSTITLLDTVFPEDGILTTEFKIPGFGVEEVNIIVDGATESITLASKDGTDAIIKEITSETYTLIKMTDVVPGEWELVTEGVPGDRIKINLIYNTNMEVEVTLDSDSETVPAGEEIDIYAKLTSGSTIADSDSQYIGYEASLCIMDAYGNKIEEVPMEVTEGQFCVGYTFDEGVYYLRVDVTGEYLAKSSESVGPVTVSLEESPENTPPEAIETPIRRTVYIWPVKGGSISVDLTSLAKDSEDESLTYQILSSSFMEGTDYEVADDILTVFHFSLSKGSFDIQATDSGGLSCNIELIIATRNVSIMATIALAILLIICLIVLAILFRIAASRPFRGSVRIESCVNGVYKTETRKLGRGRIHLSKFGLDPVGLNYRKSYLQATGKDFIYLIADSPVFVNGMIGKKHRLRSNVVTIVTVQEGSADRLSITFISNMANKSRKRRAGGSQKRTHARN